VPTLPNAQSVAEPARSPARTRALLALSAGLGGVLLAQLAGLDHPSLLYTLAVALSGASLATPGHAGRVVLLVAIACVGGGRMAAELAPPADHLVHRLSALPHDDAGRQRGLVRLTAVVTHSPINPDVGLPRYERGVFQGARSTLLADASSLDMGNGHKPTRGPVRVSVSEGLDGAPSLVPGTPITITGWMRPPSPPMNPGRPGTPREPICTIRTDGWALVAPATLASRSITRIAAPLRRLQHVLQAGARRVLRLDEQNEHPDPARALLAALILGQRDPGYEEAYDPFRRVGLAHLLAISGLHLAILAAAAAWVLRAIGPGWRVEAIGVAISVGLLLVIVPARTPIVRAGVMVLALLGARALGRRHDPLAVLAWTALAIALWDPYQVFDLGYQLSFGLVAALLSLAPHTHAAIFGSHQSIKGVLEKPPPVWRLGANYAGNSVGVLFSSTLMCWLISLPWIAWRTGLVAPLTVPATIVATPLVGILLIAAYASLLIGTIAPPLAEPLSLALYALAELCLGVVRWFDRLAYSSLESPPLSAALAICATVTLAVVARAGRHARWNHALALLVVVSWAAIEIVRPWDNSPSIFQVDTLSVGDGTAHVLRSGDEALLWDCGSIGPAAGPTTPRAVEAIHNVPVAAAVLTHANLDHANGLPRAVRELDIATLYTTPQALEAANGGGTMRDIFDDLRTQGVTIHTLSAGDTLELGHARATILWPPPNERTDDANSASLVARWESNAGHTLLLTGDIGGEALGRLIDTTDPKLFHVDVLELPHHGADDDHARRLVALSNARVVIQSAGTGRVRRDPWRDYRTQGVWLVTGRDGAIQVRFDQGGLSASTMRRGEVVKP